MFCDEHGALDYCPECLASDYDLKINKLELIVEDLEAAHLWLDDKGVPRHDKETEAEYSLVGRIMRYKET